MLNSFGSFRTELDGLNIHFLHQRSPHPNALPVILTHGWPGSIIEFHKVIAPLTNPTAHGGDAADAFDIVIPSLPGYGFSDKPSATGWKVERIATAWGALMNRLGYHRYVAQGGDWGSAVTSAMARQREPGLAGIHLNMILAQPPADADPTDPDVKDALDTLKQHRRWGTGYSQQQSTRPQTLGYGLADSPAGQAAWIYEKFQQWSDCGGAPETIFTKDEMLDNIMQYWLTNSAASSARLYWESFNTSFRPAPIELPVACSLFPRETTRPQKSWAEAQFKNIVWWNKLPRGGHFAAFEQPELFVEELRSGFRPMR